MVKQLRRKFVLTAMLSLLLILVAILGVINVVNYIQIQQGADETLEILADNDGFFPSINREITDQGEPPEFVDGSGEGNPAENEKTSDADSSNPSDNNEDSNPANSDNNSEDDSDNNVPPEAKRPDGGFGNKAEYNRSLEMPYRSRYFWVRLSAEGDVSEINTGHIAAITSSDASSIAKSLYKNKSKTSGYYDNHYRYLISTQEDGSYLMLFIDCSNEFYSANKLLFTTLLIGVVSLVGMFILVYLFSGQAVAPVVESLEKQKRFITDAGHELKTPLAVISANVDVLEIESGKSEWTTSIRGQIKRMNGLVKNMLTLSRMEEENIHVVFSDIDLSKAIIENSATFSAVADARNLKYNVDVAEDIHITGDKNSINQLSSLLIDNAMKYASENGSVNVILGLDGKGKKAIFEVSNTCDSIPDGNLDRLFDRFYRADSSRSRDTGGYGIGLSVARAIVTSHGGEIEAKRDGDHTIRFVVTIPVAKTKAN